MKTRNTAIHRLKDSMLRGATKVELNDGGGLWFKRENVNSAHWFFRTRHRGMPPKTGLGPYPAVSLQRARVISADCREAVAGGRSPREVMNELRGKGKASLTFEEAAVKTYESKLRGLRGKNQSGEWLQTLKNHAYPKLAKLRCRDITVDDVHAVLKPIWHERYPTAKKVRSRTKAVLEYAHAIDPAVNKGLTDSAAKLLGHSGHTVEHHPALAYRDTPKLYYSLTDSLEDLAFKFYLFTLPRSAPVRKMKWREIEEEAWVVPAENMKGGAEFIVPLSAAAIAQIELARIATTSHAPDDYVFPNDKAFKHGIMTENAFNNWLSKHGFDSTAHGLRSTFTDWADDNEICDRATAELALDHKIKDDTVKAYWRSTRFRQRLDLMEQWGQFVSGGFTMNSPLIIRTDQEGNDCSVSLADIYAEREAHERKEKRKANAAFFADPQSSARWLRDVVDPNY